VAIVATTWLVLGSIRETVPSAQLLTHDDRAWRVPGGKVAAPASPDVRLAGVAVTG
jgi:hypothetical protein